MSLKDGTAIALVGRRRRACYARVKITKMKKSSCTVSFNLAHNLRLRSGDKIKIVPLRKEGDEEEEFSGDMAILKAASPPKVASITFSPVEDSLTLLESSEGGDDIEDEEIKERFVTPYLEESSGPTVKEGHALTLQDENGKKLEFLVTNIALEGAARKEEEGDTDQGKQILSMIG